MTVYLQTKNHLYQLQSVMQELHLWQEIPPDEQAFQSQEPFAIDRMEAQEWLQWVFIPRMHALIERAGELPKQIAISPYIEEALKETEGLQRLLEPLIHIEKLLREQH